MKFKVTMKDPDTLHDAIADAVKELSITELSDDEMEAVRETRKESIGNICAEWFSYGEYLTVEIDTDAKTCIVVPK